MAIKPCINAYSDAGKFNEKRALKLAAMKSAIALERDFAMAEVDEELRDEIRWCWDSGLLEIVGANPLTYRVTCLGYELVAKARTQRAAIESAVAA